MPSVSDKQKKFMAAAANNPEFAKKAGIDQKVAKEFHEEDKLLEELDQISEEDLSLENHLSKDW